jgi:hypothetical protein
MDDIELCRNAYAGYAARVRRYRTEWSDGFTASELRCAFPLPSFGEFLRDWQADAEFRSLYVKFVGAA